MKQKATKQHAKMQLNKNAIQQKWLNPKPTEPKRVQQ